MASRTPVEGPDFLCIGMPKAATGWLFDQVQYHPDFWMPPVKELDYLRSDAPKLKNVTTARDRLRQRSKTRRQLKLGNRRTGDKRDLEFLDEASEAIGQPMDIKHYASLFRFKEDRLCGDISPSYITLKDEVIERIAKELPETRVMLMVRDPIARAQSQISLAYRRDKFDASLLDDPEAFREYLEEAPTTRKRSFPTAIVKRWQDLAPKVSFRWFLFDDIEKDPAGSRHEILAYIGADPEKPSGELPADHDRKRGSEKVTFPDSCKAILLEHFGEEVRACATFFNGPAQAWPARYGL